MLVARIAFEKLRPPKITVIFTLAIQKAVASLAMAAAFAAPLQADVPDQSPLPETTKAPITASTSAKTKVKAVVESDCSTKECWKGMIERYAKRYGVDPKLAVAVARCESQFRTDVYGDHGLAYGIFQFHEETFDLFAREFRLEGLEYKDPEDAIKLAIIAFSRGKEDHWSCYGKVKDLI